MVYMDGLYYILSKTEHFVFKWFSNMVYNNFLFDYYSFEKKKNQFSIERGYIMYSSLVS